MEEEKISRRCAFCFIPLAEKDVKNCGKCHQRVYCGKECQTKDWKSKKVSEPIGDFCQIAEEEGQGHKDWCGVPACEEVLDWVVNEGGKGVVAKRLILKGERILVGNGTQIQRTRPVSLGLDPGWMFNHSCNANSISNNGMDYKVFIITAKKDIAPGTEITINYIGFSNDFIPNFEVLDDGSIIHNNSFEDCRKALRELYGGIICPEDCLCYNKEIEQVIIKGKKVMRDYFPMNEFGMINVNATPPPVNFDTIQLLQNLVADFDVIDGNPVKKAEMINCLVIDLGAPQNRMHYSHLIPNYKKEADDIFGSVYNPKSPFSKLEGWLEYAFDRAFN